MKIIKMLVYFLAIPLLMWMLTGYSIFLYGFIMILVYAFENKFSKKFHQNEREIELNLIKKVGRKK